MPREVSSGDFLYRKVNPDGWDSTGVLADAFQDVYEDLSFYLSSLRTPCEVLEQFSTRKWVKSKCNTDKEPTGLEMYRAGFRVAVISVQLVQDKKCAFKKDDEGNEYSPTGHAEIINGKEEALTWSVEARCLSEEEMLNGIDQ